MPGVLFLTGLTFFIIHEMDAIWRKEWKMFSFLSTLPDEKGYFLFCFAHIPFFFLVLLIIFAKDTNISGKVIVILNAFFVLHLVLHLLFNKHRNNEFNNLFSWLIISGLCLAGLLDLLRQIV